MCVQRLRTWFQFDAVSVDITVCAKAARPSVEALIEALLHLLRVYGFAAWHVQGLPRRCVCVATDSLAIKVTGLRTPERGRGGEHTKRKHVRVRVRPASSTGSSPSDGWRRRAVVNGAGESL